jgi:hypothetical protein
MIAVDVRLNSHVYVAFSKKLECAGVKIAE